MKNKKMLAVKKVFVFVLICSLSLVAIAALNVLEDEAKKNGAHVIEEAVLRAAVTCYSTEGFYPQNIDYLAENYALYINRDEYVCHYGYLGSNILPQIKVFALL